MSKHTLIIDLTPEEYRVLQDSLNKARLNLAEKALDTDVTIFLDYYLKRYDAVGALMDRIAEHARGEDG